MRVMKAALEGAPFHLKANQIVVLTDWQADKKLQPTRANIEREFARLASAAHNGDQVFILLGGHGSQQPADPDSDDFEPDGLDETFLPSDVRGWDGKKGLVTNAIVDDDIRVWVDRIRNTGAFVWIAFDSCHSGTMMRGAPEALERERQVSMAELVPADARPTRTVVGSSQRNYAADQASPSELNGDAGEVFALYAAQSYETTPDTGRPAYGLLTSTMIEVLTQARSALTYRELTERITERYRVAGRIAPTPMFEGTGVDREVLGKTTWPDRPQWILSLNPRRGIVVNAGRLHGLTIGSVLEVFPPAGNSDANSRLGFVQVVALEPLESIVKPIAFNSTPSVSLERLSPGTRCRLAQADFGDMTLRIGLQRTREASPNVDGVEDVPITSAPATVAKSLSRLNELTKGLARSVDRPAEADWFLRLLLDGRVVLVPASGWQQQSVTRSNLTAGAFEVAPVIDNAFEPKLIASVTRLARARNLLSVAGTAADSGAGNQGNSSVKLELLRESSAAGVPVPVEFGAEGRMLRLGESVAFRMTNTTATDLDVTLLLVDADYQILSLFPFRGSANNRLDRGKTYTTPRFNVEGPTGSEQVVLIAVPAAAPPISFAALEQDPLTRSRSGPSPALSTPLGKLLERALDGMGTTRSLGAQDISTYSITLLSWRTEPAQ
jgi:hypothetical protein